MLMVTCGNIICVLATALMAFLPTHMTWGRLIAFWLVNTQSVGFTIGLVMISTNMGGYTKRNQFDGIRCLVRRLLLGDVIELR